MNTLSHQRTVRQNKIADDKYLPADFPRLLSASRQGHRIGRRSPMRFASSVRRVTAAIKEGRGLSAAKRRIKPALGRLARAVARQPVLRRGAMLFIGLVPGLKPRLRHLLHSAPASTSSLLDVSPAAQRIYRRLKRQQGNRKAS